MTNEPKRFKPKWIGESKSNGAFSGYTKKNKHFYNSKAWKTIRRQALERDEFTCQHCLRDNRYEPAVIVDHIEPINKRPELSLSLDNLQCLCRSCDGRKTSGDK